MLQGGCVRQCRALMMISIRIIIKIYIIKFNYDWRQTLR